MRSFAETVLINGHLDRLSDYVSGGVYTEHNPRIGDGLSALRSALADVENGRRRIDYRVVHHVLAEDNFALCVSEGALDGVHTAFCDLFRIADGMLVEHWDTTEEIAPRSAWKNENGKF